VLIVGGNQSAGGYEVANSLRFDDGSSDYLYYIGGTATDGKKFTYSAWFKRSEISSGNELFCIYSSNTNRLFLRNNGNTFEFQMQSKAISTTQQFRDPSAWYHFVIACDSTQATDSDRIKWYLNGELITDLSIGSGYPSLNAIFPHGQSTPYFIVGNGRYNGAFYSQYWDGYQSEVCFIDGQQLDPTSFGEFDEDSGIWKPIDVSGLTFGNNGFYLPFENSAALGQDDSGNANNFTVNNLTSIDQSTDTPTNNFCTLNPLNFGSGTLSEGNLKWAASGSVGYLAFGTIGIDMGVSNQFYWETKIDSISGGVVIGIAPPTLRWNDTGRAGSYGYYSNGDKYNGTSAATYGASFTTGDTIGVLAGNGTLTFYKNGSSQGTAYSSLTGTWLPFLAEVGQTNSMNFGSPPYTISSGNTDPDGYGNFEYSTNGGYALNTKNLAEYG
jgi:hypothetical protein